MRALISKARIVANFGPIGCRLIAGAKHRCLSGCQFLALIRSMFAPIALSFSTMPS
jgi:hypothetical protein